MPDIVVDDPAKAGHDSGIFRLREADLDKHLINDKPSDDKPGTAGKSTLSPPDTKEDGAEVAPAEFGSKNDYQLNQALNLLKGIQIMQGK